MPKRKMNRGIALPFLQTLKEIRPKQRSILLSHLDDEACETVYAAIANVLNNKKVPAKKREKLRKLLAPHKTHLRFMANGKKCNRAKKKRLVQVGGFALGQILQTALPLLLALL